MAETLKKEKPILPEEAVSKLPLLPPPGTAGEGVPEALQAAWTNYMIEGFSQNQIMFRKTLRAFTRPYWLTVLFYCALFAVGLGLFVAAAIVGIKGGSSVVALAFGGLSVATFIGFFLQRPLQSLEENLEFIAWLGVAFNTYWTRLMYIQDPATVDADLKRADDDFRASLEKLIAQHAQLRAKRPGAN
jgi:hypothetical protein